jgi:hypothetical protein
LASFASKTRRSSSSLMGNNNAVNLVVPYSILKSLAILWVVYTLFVTVAALQQKCSAADWSIGFTFYIPFFIAIGM